MAGVIPLRAGRFVYAALDFGYCPGLPHSVNCSGTPVSFARGQSSCGGGLVFWRHRGPGLSIVSRTTRWGHTCGSHACIPCSPVHLSQKLSLLCSFLDLW